MCGLNKSFKNLKPFISLFSCLFLYPFLLSVKRPLFGAFLNFIFISGFFGESFPSSSSSLIQHLPPFFSKHMLPIVSPTLPIRGILVGRQGNTSDLNLSRGNLINVTRMKDDRNLRGFSFPLLSNCAWGAIAPHCRADKLNRAEKRTVTVWMGETANNSVSDSETQPCCHRILRGTCWVQLWRVPSTSCQPLRCVLKSDRQLITFISPSGTLGFPARESFTTHM